MSNELIFIVSVLVAFSYVWLCFYKGRPWFHSPTILGLILISVFGAKLIHVFGATTNVGNIFYAMVFLAGQLIVEYYGEDEGKKNIWLGLGSVALFVALGQLVISYTGVSQSVGAPDIFAAFFKFIPRVALGSLIAYLFAQSLNIRLYAYLRSKIEPKIWIRSILSTAAGQLLDSLIFFPIAFWGTISQTELFQAVLAGFIVKFSLGVISVPFIYLSYGLITRSRLKGGAIEKTESEAILSSIGDGLVVTDRQGKIVTINKTFEETLGWKPDEVVGKQMSDVIERYDETGNKVPFKERVLSRVLGGEKVVVPFTNHSYFARKDGTKFPVTIVVSPIRVDHTIMGAVETFRDITKEKELEQEIQKRAEALREENKLMINRELRMIELKKEIEHLKKLENNDNDNKIT